jgi:hypothetical protein
MENQATENIESLFERAGDYVETRLDILKLKTADKSADIISSLASRLVILSIVIIFIIILNIGIALLLGELLGKLYYGFFILAGFYLITGLILYTNRRTWFKVPVTNLILRKIFK